MAGILTRLKAVLELNNKDFESGLNKSKKSTDAFGKSMKKIGGIIAGAFAVSKITQFTSAAINAYNKQATAEAQLLKALDGREGAQQRLIKQAGDLQKISIIGDEEIIRMQAFAASLGRSEREITKLIQVSLDLSAVTGNSLQNSVVQLNKTFGGYAGELGEIIPEVKELTREQLLAGDAVELIGKKVAGQAKVLGSTGAGEITKFANAWGDVTEKVGEAIVKSQAFQRLLPILMRNITAFTTDFSSTSVVANELADAMSFLGIEAIKTEDDVQQLIDHFTTLRDNVLDNRDALDRFGEFFFPWTASLKPANQDLKTYNATIIALFNALKTVATDKEIEAFFKAFFGDPDKRGDPPPPPKLTPFQVGLLPELTPNQVKFKLDEYLRIWGDTADEMQRFEFGSEAERLKITLEDMKDIDFEVIGERVKKMGEDLEDGTDGVRAMQESLNEFQQIAESVIQSSIVGLVDVLTEAFAVDGDPLASFKNFLGGLGRLLVQYGSALVAFGVAQEVLEKVPSGIAKIIAGGGLIAAGAILSGTASRIQAGARSGNFSGVGSGYYGGYGGGSFPGQGAFNREVVLVARGKDLVAVLNNQYNEDSYFGDKP